MILGTRFKQPVEIKDYPVDYTDWLAENAPTDTMSSATTAVACLTDPADTSLTVSNLVVSSNTVAPWLSGGTSGKRYKLTITATTTAGRKDQSEMIIIVKDT